MIFNWINIFHTEENMIQCIVNTNKNVRSSEWEKSWKRTLWKLLLTIVEVIIKVKQKIVFRPKVSWQHFFETIVADIWSTVSVWRWHSSFLVHRYLTIVLLLFFLKKKSKITFTGKNNLVRPFRLCNPQVRGTQSIKTTRGNCYFAICNFQSQQNVSVDQWGWGFEWLHTRWSKFWNISNKTFIATSESFSFL